MQADGSLGFGGSGMPLQWSWRHFAHCGRAGTPSQKSGMEHPFTLHSQTSAQPPWERRSTQAHSWHVGSGGSTMHVFVVVSQTAPAGQSVLSRHVDAAGSPPLPALAPPVACMRGGPPTTFPPHAARATRVVLVMT
jgi:hypothetical protein